MFSSEGEEDQYGFFCDIESAKTMEYEKVEYYIVKKRTHIEVRRKFTDPEINAYEKVTTKQPVSIEQLNTPEEESAPCSMKKSCPCLSFCCFSGLPKDVYYSFVICTVTASCVYFVMTLPLQ